MSTTNLPPDVGNAAMGASNAATGDRRLLKLAEFLEKLPAKRFDYGEWVGSGWKGAKDLSCGTTACALGWATAIPAFQRLGLRLIKPRFGDPYVTIAGKGWSQYDAPLLAAEKIFAVSRAESAYLFLPGENAPDEYYDAFDEADRSPGWAATPQEVARHIEQFVGFRQKLRAQG